MVEKLKSYDCVIIEHENKIIPIYYIKLDLLTKIQEIENTNRSHKNYVKMFDFIDEKKDIYMINLKNDGLPYIPITEEKLTEFIKNGMLLNDIDIDKYVLDHNKKHEYLTNAYMGNMILIAKNELIKIRNDLVMYDCMLESENISSASISPISADDD